MNILFVLALIPVVGLLLFIYFNDKQEKEPFGFLVSLFFLGMATSVTALISELIGTYVIGTIVPEDSIAFGWIKAMLIVGPAEELGKFLVLRLRTWKNKNFNYSYDAIVYAVFVSLGFAALENVGYVILGGGIITALMRMVTSVPGHACFAVFMGYFYSKAKYASLTNKNGKRALFMALAMIVPIVIHGIYDAILMGASASGDTTYMIVSIIVWIASLIALFVVSIILVIKSSRNDFCIVTLPDEVQTIYRPVILGGWNCACGKTNQLNFCPNCGRSRPMENSWYCPKCGTLSAFYFCGQCGAPRPTQQVPIQ